jgi:hypothetical protein
MSQRIQRLLTVLPFLMMTVTAFGQVRRPDRNWARDYALLPRLHSLAPMGRPARSPIRMAALVSDNWLGGTGNWNVVGNWSGGIPNNGTPAGTTYDVFIDNGNAAASVVTLNISAGIINTSINK